MLAVTLIRLRRSVFAAIARIFGFVLVAAAILGLGFASSWYMVEAGTRLTTVKIGPWVTWLSAARPDADPYTRAHFANAGTLAVSADVQRTYVAKVDTAGERLDSWCDYALEGRLQRADWWSIVAFNQQGLLVSNPAGRHAFTSQTIALSSNGSFSITLAREARAGNWLPTRGLGRLALVLTIVEPRAPDNDKRTDETALPTIRKLKCR